MLIDLGSHYRIEASGGIWVAHHEAVLTQGLPKKDWLEIADPEDQTTQSARVCGVDTSNYVLGGSENHAESTPPFPQTTLQHRAGFSKAIAVQGSLTTFSQL